MDPLSQWLQTDFGSGVGKMAALGRAVEMVRTRKGAGAITASLRSRFADITDAEATEAITHARAIVNPTAEGHAEHLADWLAAITPVVPPPMPLEQAVPEGTMSYDLAGGLDPRPGFEAWSATVPWTRPGSTVPEIATFRVMGQHGDSMERLYTRLIAAAAIMFSREGESDTDTRSTLLDAITQGDIRWTRLPL